MTIKKHFRSVFNFGTESNIQSRLDFQCEMGEGIKNKFRLLCFLLKVDYEFFTQEQGGTRTPTENEAPFLADSLVPGQLSRLCGVPRDGTFLITYTHAAASRDDYKSSRAPPSKVITA